MKNVQGGIMLGRNRICIPLLLASVLTACIDTSPSETTSERVEKIYTSGYTNDGDGLSGYRAVLTQLKPIFDKACLTPGDREVGRWNCYELASALGYAANLTKDYESASVYYQFVGPNKNDRCESVRLGGVPWSFKDASKGSLPSWDQAIFVALVGIHSKEEAGRHFIPAYFCWFIYGDGRNDPSVDSFFSISRFESDFYFYFSGRYANYGKSYFSDILIPLKNGDIGISKNSYKPPANWHGEKTPEYDRGNADEFDRYVVLRSNAISYAQSKGYPDFMIEPIRSDMASWKSGAQLFHKSAISGE